MLRFLVRLIGFLLLAGGFVGLVIDGTRSIANSGLDFTTIGQIAQLLTGPRFAAFQPAVERLHPALWDPLVRNALLLPAAVTAFVLGAVLLWLGRRPEPQIGYLAGP